jgi:hypothetical protein
MCSLEQNCTNDPIDCVSAYQRTVQSDILHCFALLGSWREKLAEQLGARPIRRFINQNATENLPEYLCNAAR